MQIASITYKRIPALLLIVLSMATAVITGCRKYADLSHYESIDITKRDTLRFLNLLSDSSYYNNTSYNAGYVLYVNDSLVVSQGRGLFSTNTTYGLPVALPIPTQGGQFLLKVATCKNNVQPPAVPDPTRIVCQTTINVPAHSGFGNVFVYDSSANKPAIKYFPATSSDPGAPAPGAFKVRLVNFSYRLDTSLTGKTFEANSNGQTYSLQLQTRDSTVIKGDENIPFGAASPYTEYTQYGTYQFLVYSLTQGRYYSSSGPMNDILGTFNMSPVTLSQYSNSATSHYNYLFPNITTSPAGIPTSPTLNYGNIGSYQFAAGGCYTIYVIGNMYSVILDRQYNTGALDNFGKIQLVNVAPGVSDLSVTITTADHQTQQVASLPFGNYTPPIMIPAGNVSLVFSSKGRTLYSYTTSVPRLANYTYYLGTDLKQVPYVFPESNQIYTNDYISGLTDPTKTRYQLVKLSELNLCPDAGNVYFTYFYPITGNTETVSGNVGGIPFEGYLPQATSPSNGIQPFDGVQPPVQFNCRLAATRTDSLANALVASIYKPFPVLPSPGTYTVVAAGLLNTQDPASAARLIMVKKTNYLPKAK